MEFCRNERLATIYLCFGVISAIRNCFSNIVIEIWPPYRSMRECASLRNTKMRSCVAFLKSISAVLKESTIGLEIGSGYVKCVARAGGGDMGLSSLGYRF